MKKLLFLLTVLIGAVLPSHAQLIINEIMQSNIDCVMDDINVSMRLCSRISTA